MITWRQFERYWYLFFLGVVIAATPFSKYIISMGQLALAGGWITERFEIALWFRQLKTKKRLSRVFWFFPLALKYISEGIFKGLKQFINHRPALIFSSVLLLHVAGLLFTSDFNYALKDLRTKLPFLVLPLIISTSENISRKTFYRYLVLLVLAVMVRSIFNSWFIVHDSFIDIREVSRNVSHIIFSLLLTLCIYSLGFWLADKSVAPWWKKGLILLSLLWFLTYLVVSKSFTGIAVTVLTLLILVPFFVVKMQSVRIKRLILLAIGIIGAGSIFSIYRVVSDYYRVIPTDLTKLEWVTSRGNRYIHNHLSRQTENGNPMWMYVQWDEMREEWNKKSKIPFDSLDLQHNPISYTVVRYLTSRGWRKDGDAVDRLTVREIADIEKGTANQVFREGFSIRGRIYEFLDGYNNYRETGDPTGSTVMQRVEFWKASLGIIRENLLTGVGTGDMNVAFAAQYEKMHTKLAPGQRLRSHNQYLSILVGFGIFGLIWFLAAILLPPFLMRKQGDFFIAVLIAVSAFSMLTEDTIESQTGVTFFVLFYSLFLFSRWKWFTK